MIESMILAGGLILFSGTVHYDLNSKLGAVKKTNTSENIDRGFYQDTKQK